MEVIGDRIVKEGQPGGAEADGERAKGEAAGHDAGLELSRPISPGAESIEDWVEVGMVERRVGGVTAKRLVQAEQSPRITR